MTKPPRRTAYELKRTAYHEALTLPCGRATVKPNYRTGDAGFAITKNPYACVSEWEKRGKLRFSPDVEFHARIMTYMAGAEESY